MVVAVARRPEPALQKLAINPRGYSWGRDYRIESWEEKWKRKHGDPFGK